MAQPSSGSANAIQLWAQCTRWSTIFSSILTLDYETFISGAVVLSPSVIAQVCVGHILEFTCNITGTLLEWTIPLIGSSHTLLEEVYQNFIKKIESLPIIGPFHITEEV